MRRTAKNETKKRRKTEIKEKKPREKNGKAREQTD